MKSTPIDGHYYGVDEVIAKKYVSSLKDHIRFVQDAGRQLGVSEKLLSIHDNSKWTKAEFPGYARHFHGGGAPDEFSYAWLHHFHYNPHHWQYWIFPDGYNSKGSNNVQDGVVHMPNIYALEMVADWMGASMAYTGSWDMKDWLWNNMPRITIHSETASYLRSTLDMLGYGDIVYKRQFAHEIGRE